MAVFPAATPATTPVAVPTVAIAALLLLHTPPVVAFVKEVVAPWHTSGVPVIVPAFANGFTVTVLTL